MGKLQMGYELFSLLAAPETHPNFDFPGPMAVTARKHHRLSRTMHWAVWPNSSGILAREGKRLSSCRSDTKAI